MRLFTPSPTTTVEGVIDRIGVFHAGEWRLDYVFTLRGDTRRYQAHLRVAGNEAIVEPVALSRAGDHVSFTVKERDPLIVHRRFENSDI